MELNSSIVAGDIVNVYPYNLANDIFDGDMIKVFRVHVPSLIELLESNLFSERDRTVMLLRYKAHCTLDEIAHSIERTKQRVRQIIEKALRKFRCHFAEFVFASPEKFKELTGEVNALRSTNKLLMQLRCLLNVSIEKRSEDEWDDIPIDELELSVRSYNCMLRAGIRTIGDLSGKTRADLLGIRNLGRRSADEVIAKAAEFGLIIS